MVMSGVFTLNMILVVALCWGFCVYSTVCVCGSVRWWAHADFRVRPSCLLVGLLLCDGGMSRKIWQ